MTYVPTALKNDAHAAEDVLRKATLGQDRAIGAIGVCELVGGVYVFVAGAHDYDLALAPHAARAMAEGKPCETETRLSHAVAYYMQCGRELGGFGPNGEVLPVLKRDQVEALAIARLYRY